MNIKIITKYFIIFIIIFSSCNNSSEPKKVIKPNKKTIININKYLVNKDNEHIKSYIKRHKLDMLETKSGLWYMISENGNNDKCKKGDTLIMNYTVSLLDGTICYSSDSLKEKSFILGKGEVISGLEEGILLLNKSSKAKFIIPPHLAYGLIGDENRIPARTTIIYDIELIKRKNIITNSK